jgi:hypothetical protein
LRIEDELALPQALRDESPGLDRRLLGDVDFASKGKANVPSADIVASVARSGF